MHLSTKVTKSTEFSQLFNCYWSVLPVVGVKLQSICHRAVLCHRLIMTRRTVWAAQRKTRKAAAVVWTRLAPVRDRTNLQYSAEIILFYRRREAGMCVWQCPAETVQSRERSGEKRRGNWSRLHLKRDVQLCYSEGCRRVRSVRPKKRLHSEESGGGTLAPRVTSGMLPPGSVSQKPKDLCYKWWIKGFHTLRVLQHMQQAFRWGRTLNTGLEK